MSSSSPELSSSSSSTGISDEGVGPYARVLHETCVLLVFLGKELLGEAHIDPGACPEMGYRRGGVAYFCPVCGSIWGRIVLFGPDGEQREFEVATVACEAHSELWYVPGSFLSGSRCSGYLPYLPDSALRREVQVHLKWWEATKNTQRQWLIFDKD